jgi:hypothetical protein
MPIVYLVCPLSTPNVDLKPVEAFGSLETINARYVYGDEIENQKLPPEFVAKLDIASNNFNPSTDYLMIGGDHVQFACMAAMLGSYYGEFRVLRWDRMARGYVPVKFEIWR